MKKLTFNEEIRLLLEFSKMHIMIALTMNIEEELYLKYERKIINERLKYIKKEKEQL